MTAYDELVERCVNAYDEGVLRAEYPEQRMARALAEVHRTLDRYLSAPISVAAFLAILAPDPKGPPK